MAEHFPPSLHPYCILPKSPYYQIKTPDTSWVHHIKMLQIFSSLLQVLCSFYQRPTISQRFNHQMDRLRVFHPGDQLSKIHTPCSSLFERLGVFCPKWRRGSEWLHAVLQVHKYMGCGNKGALGGMLLVWNHTYICFEGRWSKHQSTYSELFTCWTVVVGYVLESQ